MTTTEIINKLQDNTIYYQFPKRFGERKFPFVVKEINYDAEKELFAVKGELGLKLNYEKHVLERLITNGIDTFVDAIMTL